jgi:hypothetical protein
LQVSHTRFSSKTHKVDFPSSSTELFPGVDGIGSGVGFEVDNQILNLAAIYKWDQDKLSRAPLSDIFRRFFRDSSAVVFVVDNSRSLNEAKEELQPLLEDSVIPKTVPILILVCCSEEESSSLVHRPIDICEELQLNHIETRPWKIQTVNIQSMTGIKEAFGWLVSQC